MTKDEAIAVVTASYPAAIVVHNELTRMSELWVEPLRLGSPVFGVSGPAAEAWIRFAEYMKKGVVF